LLLAYSTTGQSWQESSLWLILEHARSEETEKHEKDEISDQTDYLLALISNRKWFLPLFSMLIEL
jgi:hypothetical protein